MDQWMVWYFYIGCGQASKMTKLNYLLFFAQIIFYRRYFADNIITIDLYSGKNSNNKVSILPERRMV